jgi:hypothetical protein
MRPDISRDLRSLVAFAASARRPVVPILAAGAVAVAANGHRSPAGAPMPAATTIIGTAGFNQPENLVYDSVANVYYVSSMGSGAHGATLDALLTNVTSPAGLAVDSRHHRLAVTSIQDNRLYLVPLEQ